MATVKILLKTNKINSAGEAPLCIRITKDRNSKFIFLNYRIKPDCWDDSKGKVKKSHPNYQQLNSYLADKIKEAEAVALKMETADKKILPELIKEQIMGKAPVNFFQFADKYVLELRANHRLGSYKKTKTVVDKIREYTGGRELFFDHITVTWVKDYSQYLKTEKVNRQNTVSNNLRTLRRIINLAIYEDLLADDKNPFRKFKIVTEKVKKEFLTDEELMMIELAPLVKNSRIDHTRNMYIFSAYGCGLRISDMLLLRWENFNEGKIVMQTKKTGSTVSIKLPDVAVEILKRYKTEDAKPEDFIFPVFKNDVDYTNPQRLFFAISNADEDINFDLREIVKIIGLDKKVTFHSARHTFATRALRMGIRIEYLSKLLGHASISTTQIYAQVINTELDKAMELLNVKKIPLNPVSNN